jgi:hypothetical protein
VLARLGDDRAFRIDDSSIWIRRSLKLTSLPQPWMNSTSVRRPRTDSSVVRNSSVPTAVDARRGVKTKYDRGDTTTVWNFLLSSSRESTNPAHLERDVSESWQDGG